MSIEELQQYCRTNNIDLPENRKNKRYLVRSIENSQHNATRQITPDSQFIVVGVTTQKAILIDRIAKRFDDMIRQGILEEASEAIRVYGNDAPGLSGNIYRLVAKYGSESIDLQELRDKFIVLDWRLAKRQRTWFARNNCIHWCELDQAVSYIETQLAKRSKI